MFIRYKECILIFNMHYPLSTSKTFKRNLLNITRICQSHPLSANFQNYQHLIFTSPWWCSKQLKSNRQPTHMIYIKAPSFKLFHHLSNRTSVFLPLRLENVCQQRETTRASLYKDDVSRARLYNIDRRGCEQIFVCLGSWHTQDGCVVRCA